MKYLIQFTGAQSTGKSTLAWMSINKLQGIGRTVSFIGETSRTLKKNDIITDLDIKASIVDQLLINGELLVQFFERLNLARDQEIIVAERTAFCCLAYANELVKNNYSEGADYMLNHTLRFERAARSLANADTRVLTFYCPPNIEFVADGIRHTESQAVIDSNIKGILNLDKVPYITVPPGDERERFTFVMQHIQEFLE